MYVKALGNQAAITAALDWYRANIKDRQFTVPTLGPVSVPTLMVWSDQDSYICRAGIDLTRSFVKAPYHLAVLSGVNHWVPENAADALDALLLAHFRGQDGG